MTYTYALLDVSPACYQEIRQKLEAAGYQHAFHEDDGVVVIDLHGIALREQAVVHMDTGKDLLCGAETEHATWTTVVADVSCAECREIIAASAHAAELAPQQMKAPKVGDVLAVNDEPQMVTETQSHGGVARVVRTMPVREYWLNVLLDPDDPTQTLAEKHARKADGAAFQMWRVPSSNIYEIGWRAGLRRGDGYGVLRIRFVNGGLFEYVNVPRAWFEQFLLAPSKGRFFQTVKNDPATFPYTKIEGGPPTDDADALAREDR